MAKKTTGKLEKLNETGRRTSDRRTSKTKEQAKSESPVVERRKVKRRRQIDPTTCEREYSDPEIEFMQAMDEYKRASGRMFPTCSEILEVLTKIGYRKVADAEVVYLPEGETREDEEESNEDELESMEELV
ncbi:MAG: hypothetical protein AAF939_16705 [Planctomycetota bacterium]